MIQRSKSFFDILDKEKIQALLRESEPYLQHRAEMYRRYARKSEANGTMKSANDRIVVAFEYYIVNVAKGYLSGKPPTYSVAKGDLAETYQQAIDEIRRYNDDAATFSQLMHDYLVTGAAYLYIIENADNEVEYLRADSRNTVCVYDYGTPPYPLALLRVLREADADGREVKKLEIVTDKYRRIYDENGGLIPFEDYGDDGLQTMTEKRLHWGDVPAAAFENTDGIAIFEPVLGLIDTYENLLTNVRSSTQYNDNAKLKIVGYQAQNVPYLTETDNEGNPVKRPNPAWKQEEKELYEASVLFLDNDGSIDWMIKNIDYAGILEVLRKLEEIITMVCAVPNMTDRSVSNASGIALGFMFYSLDQYAANVDRVFRKGYLRLWEIVTGRLNLKNDTSYDFRDVDVQFLRNIPTDRNQTIERAAATYAAGLLSLESAIAESGLNVDAAAEVARIEAEKIRIKDPQQIIDLRTAGLVDEVSATEMLYGEDKAKRVRDGLASETLAVEDMVTGDSDETPRDTAAAVAKEDAVATAADVAGKTLTGVQTASLIDVIEKYAAGALTLQQAVNIVSVSIGVSKDEAKRIIEGLE